MAEEITTKGIWSLIKSNIGTLVIIGSLVINAVLINNKKVVSDYQQSLDQSANTDTITAMRLDIKSIQTSVSLQGQSWTEFKTEYKAGRIRDSVQIMKVVKGIIVLDTAIQKHLRNAKLSNEYIQLLRDQIDIEKKNYNWIPLDTVMIKSNIVSGLNMIR